MDTIAISAIKSTSPKYSGVWDLREEILRRPLGLSLRNEDLSRDKEDDIIIAEHDNIVIACLLLHPLEDNNVQLRAMAVYGGWQGKGIGKLLVQSAEKFCMQKGYMKIVLHARKVALGFYSGMGYTTCSDEFTEVGIPHFMMEKFIAAIK